MKPYCFTLTWLLKQTEGKVVIFADMLFKYLKKVKVHIYSLSLHTRHGKEAERLRVQLIS